MKDSYLLQTGFRVPQWKLSVTFSIVIHLLAVVLILLAPTAKKESEKPIITRLMTPDEWMQQFPREMPSEAPPKELYGARRGSSAPKPAIPRKAKSTPSIPSTSPVQPRSRVPENGVVPNTLARDRTEQEATVPGKSDDSSVQNKVIANPSPKSSGIPLPPSLREKLFDREVVGQVARREEKTHDNSVTFNTTEFRYAGYMEKLKEKFEGSGCWVYPAEAASRGIYGDVRINFTIRKNGSLGEAELIRTSGHRMLDEAAMRAVKECAPFWPLLEEWGKDYIEIRAHFVYSIYGTYIR